MSIQSRPLDAPRLDPPPAPLKPVAGALKATFDRLTDRVEVEPSPPPPNPAKRPAAPKFDPNSPQRRRLHEWIVAYDADLIVRADLHEIVRQMLGVLKRNRPIDGVIMDPYEQARLALEDAARREEAGELDRSIGVYALGMIKNRIGPAGYVPLIDPTLKLDADAKEREAEEARKREGAEAKSRAQAEARDLDAANTARYESLPPSVREPLEARVRAENPGLRNWPNMLKPLYVDAMLAMERQPSTVAEPVPVPTPIPPPAPAAAPNPISPVPALSRPRFTPVDRIEPTADDARSFEAMRLKTLAMLDTLCPRVESPNPPARVPDESPPDDEPEFFGRPRPKPRTRRPKKGSRRQP